MSDDKITKQNKIIEVDLKTALQIYSSLKDSNRNTGLGSRAEQLLLKFMKILEDNGVVFVEEL